MSTKMQYKPKWNVNTNAMSIKMQCKLKCNVNQNAIPTKMQCQPKCNINQNAMSTKMQCQSKCNVNQKVTKFNTTKPISTQPNDCHIEVTQPYQTVNIFLFNHHQSNISTFYPPQGSTLCNLWTANFQCVRSGNCALLCSKHTFQSNHTDGLTQQRDTIECFCSFNSNFIHDDLQL